MKNKPKIAIFIHHPQCSIQSAHGIVRSLYYDFDIDCIGRHQLRDKNLNKYDLIAVPGGIGDSDTWHQILEPFSDTIKNFVAKDKKYLGICMGAYWAGSYYLNLLDGVQPVQYIKRPKSKIKRSFGTVTEVEWEGEHHYMYFYDGCAFKDEGGQYKIIAKYSNQDPAAIIQHNIGLIGPHPESDIYWYSKQYMKSYWHNYTHHKLLLNFVKKLFLPS